MGKIKSGYMECEEILSNIEEEVKLIDQYLFQEAAIEHIDYAIEYLTSLKNTISSNL